MYEDLSLDDAKQLFHRTLVRHNNRPVVIREVVGRKGNFAANLLDLSSLNMVEPVPLLDKGFDFTPVSLGYVNEGLDTFYVCRQPKRAYKVGLSAENISVNGIRNTNSSVNSYENILCLNSKGLAATIQKQYPSMNEALDKLVNKQVRSIGIMPSFAIGPDFQLYFKGQSVGIIDSDNGKPVFLGNKAYLKSIWEM